MELPGTEKWKFTDIQFLPIVREFAKQINLVETINTMVDSKMRLTPGDVVLAMVIDTVTGRKPLYRFEESLHALDTELILGKPIDPAEFNDTNLGRAMDKLYETGTHRIFPQISQNAINGFKLDTKHHHFDITSVTVFGDSIYIADSAFVTPGNLAKAVESDIRFLSRLPANLIECKKAILNAIAADDWQEHWGSDRRRQ